MHVYVEFLRIAVTVVQISPQFLFKDVRMFCFCFLEAQTGLNKVFLEKQISSLKVIVKYTIVTIIFDVCVYRRLLHTLKGRKIQKTKDFSLL